MHDATKANTPGSLPKHESWIQNLRGKGKQNISDLRGLGSGASVRSADCESAVSPNGIRPGARNMMNVRGLSAVRIANPRHSRLPIGVTSRDARHFQSRPFFWKRALGLIPFLNSARPIHNASRLRLAKIYPERTGGSVNLCENKSRRRRLVAARSTRPPASGNRGWAGVGAPVSKSAASRTAHR